MFSKFIGIVSFGITSLIMLWWIWDLTHPTELEQRLRSAGVFQIQWRTVLTVLAIWCASGVFIWG